MILTSLVRSRQILYSRLNVRSIWPTVHNKHFSIFPGSNLTKNSEDYSVPFVTFTSPKGHTALIDTGEYLTKVTNSEYSRFGNNIPDPILNPRGFFIPFKVGASEKFSELKKTMKNRISFKIGSFFGTTVEIWKYLENVEEIEYDLILGCEFLKASEAILDFNECVLEFMYRGRQLDLRLEPESEKKLLFNEKKYEARERRAFIQAEFISARMMTVDEDDLIDKTPVLSFELPLKDTKASAVVQTAFPKSYISQNFIEKNGLNSSVKNEKNGEKKITITTEDGKDEKENVDMTFVVLDMSQDLVIGSDFLFQHKCLIDFIQDDIYFPNTGTALPFKIKYKKK